MRNVKGWQHFGNPGDLTCRLACKLTTAVSVCRLWRWYISKFCELLKWTLTWLSSISNPESKREKYCVIISCIIRLVVHSSLLGEVFRIQVIGLNTKSHNCFGTTFSWKARTTRYKHTIKATRFESLTSYWLWHFYETTITIMEKYPFHFVTSFLVVDTW